MLQELLICLAKNLVNNPDAVETTAANGAAGAAQLTEGR